MPGSGVPLFQAATANLNPWTEVKVKSKNPDRGPLLIIDGEKDHTVPWAIANASYKKQKRNEGVTEIVEMAGRGHSLTIDHGWREVADTALALRAALRQALIVLSRARRGTSTAAPSIRPFRMSSSASLARSNGYSTVCVSTGTRGASARKSTASWRVRLATDRMTRSSQRSR